jgi:hypothetical protein
MRFKEHRRGRSYTLDDRWAYGDIWDKAAVHHVNVQPIGTPLIRLFHRIAQVKEVTGEDRRSDLNSGGSGLIR